MHAPPRRADLNQNTTTTNSGHAGDPWVLRQPQPAAGGAVEVVAASPLAGLPASPPIGELPSVVTGAHGSASGLPFHVPGVAIAYRLCSSM